MVSLDLVQASNSQIASVLPAGLVAVFVGGTNGIGEYTLKQFAKHALKPRVYFIGRAQEAADRIIAECKALNVEGEYTFIKGDTSLIKNVDVICRDIKAKEKSINLLVLTTGTLVGGIETSEGLHFASALVHYSRNRFVVNLLPLLQAATGLRRVVSVFTATKEGPVTMNDIQCRKVPIGGLIKARGHGASLTTMCLETIAEKAPDVSFIHDFPGPVKSGISRGTKGILWFVLRVLGSLPGLTSYIPKVESGERHLFLATSARYPARNGGETTGVPLENGVTVARGTDGKNGSGVYSIDEWGESAEAKVEELLAGFRKEGTVEKVWEDMETEWKRITGEVAV